MEELFSVLQQTTFGGRQSASVKQMTEDITSGDDMREMQGLTAMCHHLNMNVGSVMSLNGLSPSVLVPPILICLQKEYLPELVILAARSLSYLTDAAPSTVHVLCQENNADMLLGPVRAITDMEVAEQCLTCIGNVCERESGAAALFAAGGVSVLLGFLDFFTIYVQRKIWKSVLLMCRSVNSSNYDRMVKESLPTIQQATAHSDSTIRSLAYSTIIRIVNGVHDDRVDVIMGPVVKNIEVHLLDAETFDNTFSTALQLLTVCVLASAGFTKTLVESGILTQLAHLLQCTLAEDSYNATTLELPTAEQQSPASPAVSSPTGLTAGAPNHISVAQQRLVCNLLKVTLPPYLKKSLLYIPTLLQFEIKGATPPEGQEIKDDAEGSDYDTVEEDDEDEGDDEEADDIESTENTDEAQWEEGHRRLQEVGIKLSINLAYKKCVLGRHTCDACHKRMEKLQDWFHCNQCNDFDFCLDCILKHGPTHQGGRHSFTDMYALYKHVVAIRKVERTALHAEKEKLYETTPALMNRQLSIVPTMIQFFLEAETVVSKMESLSFVLNCVALASADQLRNAAVSPPLLAELVAVSIRDRSLICNLFGVAIATVLLEKVPSEFAEPLYRAGVLAATEEMARQPMDSVSKKEMKKSMEERVSSVKGWNSILREETRALRQLFPLGVSDAISSDIARLSELLAAKEIEPAMPLLRSLLLNNVTSFELMSSKIFASLRLALMELKDIDTVVRLVAMLAEPPSEAEMKPAAAGAALPKTESCNPLVLFVHHLQRSIANTENFQPLNFGFLKSIRTQVALNLLPQTSVTANEATATAEGSPTGGPESPKVKTRSASVSIVPLANVEAICNFISSHLLDGGEAGRRMSLDEGADDRVEEVLPEASALKGRPPQRYSSIAAREKDRSNVWVRWGQYILPLSTTAAQILQLSLGSKGRGKGADRAASGAAASSAGSAKTKDDHKLTLFYSVGPFPDGKYEMLPPFLKHLNEVDSPQDDIHVLLPSREVHHFSVVAVLEKLVSTFPCSKGFVTETQKSLFALLGMLYECAKHWQDLLRYTTAGQSLHAAGTIPTSIPIQEGDFVVGRLDHKAMSHCTKFLMAGQHTRHWAVNVALDCPFLFAPSTRKFLFEVSFCGTLRSLVRLTNSVDKYGYRDTTSADHSMTAEIRQSRAKKRVWRDRALECAMELLGKKRRHTDALWEFEFYKEEGSGLGPSREFYTLVAQELRARHLRLWRDAGEEESSTYFTPRNGLYPRPNVPGSPEAGEQARYFLLMGRFLSKALLDGHIASMCFSPILLKLLRGDTCGIYDVCEISEEVGNVLVALTIAAKQGSDAVLLPGQRQACGVADLGLTFTLPGDDRIALKRDGATSEVTASNALEYCDLVVEYLLKTGVQVAVKALRKGFHDYIPLAALRLLSIKELNETLNGFEEKLTKEELEKHCLADHGYTCSCSHVQWLFDIISEFTLEEQQDFLAFLTGSPHLPVGGLSSYTPKITVVRKTSSEANIKEGDQLPSAMTCQNYLKLPAYETKEQMRSKLKQAMQEGKGAFLLT
ncbi:E3 ubiquitin-protein ligase TRIP12 [Strigomonas culicis]|uniref:HECT-type E3 ubiquitin transferase n=1 Tax=Strigomonas culicis TaxID=28005 RepID=S9VJ17_9TRYP|nr:E3 ubiquitin-protein ligase TRIP12 [Strigomonas culicis]|eukprot:EPY23190.1 E3 ubiquitin-protein ligase TRIP12 [Strigomonas culicis]